MYGRGDTSKSTTSKITTIWFNDTCNNEIEKNENKPCSKQTTQEIKREYMLAMSRLLHRGRVNQRNSFALRTRAVLREAPVRASREMTANASNAWNVSSRREPCGNALPRPKSSTNIRSRLSICAKLIAASSRWSNPSIPRPSICCNDSSNARDSSAASCTAVQ